MFTVLILLHSLQNLSTAASVSNFSDGLTFPMTAIEFHTHADSSRVLAEGHKSHPSSDDGGFHLTEFCYVCVLIANKCLKIQIRLH